MFIESIKTFFSTSDFMPHIHCYLAKPSLVWTMFSTDLLIGTAYVSISLSLYALLRKIQLPFSPMFLAFGLFIFACGMTHFMEVYTLWVPAYWSAAFIKAVTAIASIFTAVYLVKIAPAVHLFAVAAKESQQKSISIEKQSVVLANTLEELKKTQDRFHMMIQGVKDYAIYMLDTEGRIESWNEGAKFINQYESNEVLGKSFALFYSPEDVEKKKPEQDLLAAKTLGRFEDVGWRVRKDGTRFWVTAIITSLKDNSDKLIGFSQITRDLTESKNAEDALRAANELLDQRVRERTEELRESELQFRMFADSMPQLAWIARSDGFVIWFNKGWYDYTGSAPEEVEGWGWHSLHDPKTISKTLVEWNKSIESHKPLEITFQLRGADGEYRWFITRVTPIFNSRGELTRWFGTCTNIDERNRELENANKELEAFSYSVSHDLRAPLRSLDGFSKILLTEYSEILDEKGKNYLIRIRLAAQKMGKLIDALIGLSRVSRTKMKLDFVDLSLEVKRVLEELKQSEPDRIVSTIVAEGVTVQADTELIRSLLQNLLGNAWKFTGKKDHPTIEFGVRNERGRPVYFVKDNGAGFDMTYADKLFKAFQRLHSDSEFEGTGIGLVTVQRIVRRHGGEVWVEARPDEGATFYFTLKMEEEK